MKKFLFYFVLFSSVYVNAQTTIVEEKFEKDNEPLSYNYLPKSNKIIIEKGSKFRKVNTVLSYDINEKKEILAKNVDVMDLHYSATENSIYAPLYSGNVFGGSFNYIVDSKATPLAKISDIKNAFDEEFGAFFFNDKYELGFSNEKNKRKIDLSKDMLFLEVTDIFTRSTKKIKLEKPKLSNAAGDSNFSEFKANIISKDSFEIISGSNTKDHKSITRYITTYNIEGKKLNEIACNIYLKDYSSLFSFNGGGLEVKMINDANANVYKTYLSNIFYRHFAENEIYQDTKTGDIYIYGLFVNEYEKMLKSNSPMGYYIFKFDKTGKKVWESINKIDDKNDFNDKSRPFSLKSNLTIYNNKLFLSIGADYSNQFLHYAFLDKENGKILNNNKITFTKKMAGSPFINIRYFILSFYEYEGLDNKVFDYDGLVAIDSNKKVADYVKNIDNKNKLYFNTIFSNEGIWLIESDNKDYYKVTFFKA